MFYTFLQDKRMKANTTQRTDLQNSNMNEEIPILCPLVYSLYLARCGHGNLAYAAGYGNVTSRLTF